MLIVLIFIFFKFFKIQFVFISQIPCISLVLCMYITTVQSFIVVSQIFCGFKRFSCLKNAIFLVSESRALFLIKCFCEAYHGLKNILLKRNINILYMFLYFICSEIPVDEFRTKTFWPSFVCYFLSISTLILLIKYFYNGL